MNTFLLLCSLLPGDRDSDAAAALALAAASIRHNAPTPVESAISDDYDNSYRRAVRLRQSLIVWVGQQPIRFQGAVCCYQPTFPSSPAKCVIVSKPIAGSLYWLATLEGTPSVKQIDAVLKRMPEGVSSWGGSLPSSVPAPEPLLGTPAHLKLQASRVTSMDMPDGHDAHLSHEQASVGDAGVSNRGDAPFFAPPRAVARQRTAARGSC